MVCIIVKDARSLSELRSQHYFGKRMEKSSMRLMKSGLLARVTDLNSVKRCCNNLGCLSSYVRARRKEMEGALR